MDPYGMHIPSDLPHHIVDDDFKHTPGVASTPQPVLRILGAFALTLQSSPVPIRRTEQRVLSLLAVRGPMCRAEIADTLWPDLVEQQGRACLRASLSRIRAINDVIALVSDVVTLSIVTDYQTVMEWAEAVLSDQTGQLTAPLPQVRRELLAGWDEVWLCEPREELRTATLCALEMAAIRLASNNRLGMALSVAKSATMMDPLRESAARVLIEIHLREGNSAAAVSEYRRLYDLMHQATGTRPNASLTSLVAGLTLDQAPILNLPDVSLVPRRRRNPQRKQCPR